MYSHAYIGVLVELLSRDLDHVRKQKPIHLPTSIVTNVLLSLYLSSCSYFVFAWIYTILVCSILINQKLVAPF